MQARGDANSGNNYVSQLVSGDQAQRGALQQAQQQAAIAQQQKMAALQGASSVGGELQNNAYKVAGANDAINQFNKQLQVSNSQNTLSAAQDSVTNELNRAGGLANVYSNQGSLQEGKAAGMQGQLANVVGNGFSGLPGAIKSAVDSGGGGNPNGASQGNGAMDHTWQDDSEQ
jgi:hypothetical protein